MACAIDSVLSVCVWVSLGCGVSSRQEVVGNSSLYMHVCSGGCLIRLGNITKKRSSNSGNHLPCLYY